MAFVEELFTKILLIGISVLILHRILEHFDEDKSYKHSFTVAAVVGLVEYSLSFFSYSIMPMLIFFISLFIAFFILRYVFELSYKTTLKIVSLWYPIYFLIGYALVIVIQLL